MQKHLQNVVQYPMQMRMQTFVQYIVKSQLKISMQLSVQKVGAETFAEAGEESGAAPAERPVACLFTGRSADFAVFRAEPFAYRFAENCSEANDDAGIKPTIFE